MQDIFDMDRRALMKNLALLLGAATIPTLAGCKAAMDGAGALDAGQLKLMGAIADTLIPKTDTGGAVEVGVPQMISGMIATWASADSKTELLGAIAAIGALGGGKFADADPAQRKTLLLAHDADAVKPGPPPEKPLTGVAAMMGGAPPVMNPAYVKLKGLVIDLYYFSQLASTKELVFEPVPGKFVPSLPVTPETRPFAGLGGPF